MRTPVRHISYRIRHTALSRTYGIVAYVRHNNNADSPVFGIPHFPIEMNRLSSRWNSGTHGTRALTQVFDSKHMDVKKMIGDINVCIIKSKDWPIDMAERTTTLFIIAFL